MANESQTPDYEVLKKALLLACRRVADSGQTYEEANTAEGWADRFIGLAKEEVTNHARE